MAKKRRRRRKKNHRVYALVTLVLAIAIIVIGFGLLFYVQKIEVSGNDYTENEVITESMQKDTLSFNSVYLRHLLCRNICTKLYTDIAKV